ncbi:MAG: EamA family transporter [Coriobacteriia bacterium]|nr:EamA family transporter [Coriobacteriia bacterium]
MLTAPIAALSAALYGVADFLGGFGSRKDSPLVVTFAAQVVGLAAVAAVTVFMPPASWTDPRILWGLGAGVFGGGGVLALYSGLATGRMSVVAPVAAALTGALPAAVGLIRGTRIGPLGLLGMALAIVAVVIVSMFSESEEAAVASGSAKTALWFAMAAGIGFGISVVCFSQTPASTSFAPLILARSTTITVMLVLTWARMRRLVPVREALAVTLATGVFDAAANVSQVIALRIGPLALAAVVGALYPVVTVLLARVVLHEHLRGIQRVGVVMALVAVVLCAMG